MDEHGSPYIAGVEAGVYAHMECAGGGAHEPVWGETPEARSSEWRSFAIAWNVRGEGPGSLQP